MMMYNEILNNFKYDFLKKLKMKLKLKMVGKEEFNSSLLTQKRKRHC
jgi:hypothetical protein